VSKGGDDELVRELDRKQNTHAITNDQAGDVDREATRGEVESDFGPPLPDQGGSTRGAGNDVCIYYNVRDSRSYDQWRFCFEGPTSSGKLTLKNRFS